MPADSRVLVLEGLGEPVPSREACSIWLGTKASAKKAAKAAGRAAWKGTKWTGRKAAKGIHHLSKRIAASTSKYAGLGGGRPTPQQARFAKAAKHCRLKSGGQDAFRSCMRRELKK
jgi:hypothetical protein